ncbi:MAG: DUF5615 family PIN-like protein [Bacteroidetes bacterium]|nr:DUF5615 family PIN-like protein [Bacteroidota bacterium]MCB0851397.1 DUF5615 family PIN-like protein [Bacteroidota bacterium]
MDYPKGPLLQDDEIINIAIDEDRIILTKDQDFLDHYMLKGSPPKVIMLQFGNISNTDLLKYFQANQMTLNNLLTGGAELILFSRSRIIEYKKGQ